MALAVPSVGLLFFVFYCLVFYTVAIPAPDLPSVSSVYVIKPSTVTVIGSGLDLVNIAVTRINGSKGDICKETIPVEVKINNSTYAIMKINGIFDKSETFYTCLRTNKTYVSGVQSTLSNEVIKWTHQGEEGAFHLIDNIAKSRERRSNGNMRLFGIRVESSDSAWFPGDDGVPQIRLGTRCLLRIFGAGIRDDTHFVLTQKEQALGEHCDFPVTEQKQILKNSIGDGTALLLVELPKLGEPGALYYFCYKHISNTSNATTVWTHLGAKPFTAIRSYQKLLPLYVSIVIISVCLMFSSLFSGLNLGLMSLDKTDLKIIANTGTKNEKKYAQAITPVRSHGNFLLCSILLGNVMVNSTFTILLDDLTSGVTAVLASTLLIVIFGEITPQAVCSRYGLAVGAKTIIITKAVMALTSPLSYPISKVLDKILGEEIGAVYNRERLKELVKLTTEYNDLEKDEVNIISGALDLGRKIARDVMTNIEDAYMLPIDAVLDFETVSEISQSGFSRVPVYEGNRNNIVSLLYTKDLALIDTDDNIPLRTHCEFYQNSCYFVFEDTTLDVLFKQFKDGMKGHLALVHRVNTETDGDPFYETIGLITFEDVIEELIQAEINDETDVYTDNKTKRRRKTTGKSKQNFSTFAEKNENQKIHISPQLALATFQFLKTSVDAFKSENISETVLRRLLKQDVFYQIKIKDKTKKMEPFTIIYEQGKPVDYFVLILEGRVEVTVGRENLIFESGPFTYFGSQALIQNVGVVLPAESPSSGNQPLGSLQSVNLDSKLRTTFVPDYGVRALTDVFYLKIKRSMYLTAKRATLLEWTKKEESNENFEDEMDKLMNFGTEDSRSQGSPEVTRTYSQAQSGKTSPQLLNNGPLTNSEPLLNQASSMNDPNQTRESNNETNSQEESQKLLPS